MIINLKTNLTFSLQSNCWKKFIYKTNITSLNTYIDIICSNMYDQCKEIEDEKFDKKDLFMENSK